MLQETILHGSLATLHESGRRCWLSFVLDYLCEDLWKKERVTSSGTNSWHVDYSGWYRWSLSAASEAGLGPENSGSLSLGCLFCNTTHCVWRGHQSLGIRGNGNSCRAQGSGNQHKNSDLLAAVIALSNKLFFVSNPGVSCLLPRIQETVAG